MTTLPDADVAWDQIIELRRALHAEPELGLLLPATQQKILRALDGLPVEITTGERLSSVTAVLHGGRPGPAVLLRADMDALPAADGAAGHTCGHDLHVAALVGAVELLARGRDELPGSVVFMFQPGEEGNGGARIMVEEGVLDAAGERVAAAYALHVLSAILPNGWAATRGGPLLAAADLVRVTVKGAGGHGSQPHLARDPVVAACTMVTTLQTLVTREFDVFDPVVFNIGVLRAGAMHNIVPEQAYFEVSVRSYSQAARDRAVDGIRRMVEGVAAGHRVEAAVEHEAIYPVTVTDQRETGFAIEVAGRVLGADRVVELPHPVTASEDFAFVLDQVPGAFVFLGACPPGVNPGEAPVNHSADAVFDEAVLPDAARLLAELARRRLAREADG